MDASGQQLASYYYDAFGNPETVQESVYNPYRYAGYMWDDETGKYYLMARMYDPETARFLQEDSYRGNKNDPLSLNLYTYCHNEPLMYSDPSGHDWVSTISDIKKKLIVVKKKVVSFVNNPKAAFEQANKTKLPALKTKLDASTYKKAENAILNSQATIVAGIEGTKNM